MDAMKVKKLKDAVCDRIDQFDQTDLGRPQMVEYAKNLASLHNKLCKMCEDEEGASYANRMSMRGNGDNWSAYDDGMSMRRGRDSMGRYTSYAGYAEAGGPKEQLRRILDDPSLSREDRDEIQRVMARIRG